MISLILLSALITVGCVTNKTDITLPPKPQREVMPEITSVKDFAEVINYYEHLIQKWEQWGFTVEQMTENTTTAP